MFTMEWMGLNEIREQFLSFFESKRHVRLDSYPLIPQDDASLLLVNAGMAPLKKYFLGLDTPPAKRVTTCQKCIRTPDIERVGKTSRHGTFFEMLGNFSFGDYFKDEATAWALEFVVDVMKMPIDRIWVSIFEDDDEAFEIWTKKRGFDPGRVVRLGREDNFWEIGSGPCGPCSEIYFDRGEEYGCGSPGCAVGCDCDRYVEIWNLVFTQFNSDGKGNYEPLEHPNIDTGMGLERLACIMQGVDNLFEVDTIQNVMKHIAQIAGVTYKMDERTDVSLRVVTDHIRSTVFMVGDGVVPQNEGRGYVLRRLLRRASRHGRLLGITEPFLYKVCDTVIKENLTAYPALSENADYIRKVIKVEEERFSKTIEQGMELLSAVLDRIEEKQIGTERPVFPGEEAFKLYDTFGFPLDLTKEIAADKGFVVDEDRFMRFMNEQRDRARKAREELGGVSWEDDVLAERDIDDRFVGYDRLKTTTRVLEVVREGELVEEVNEGQEAVIVLGETPFYAESGGQVGDTGIINVGKSMFKVTDCKKSPTGHIMHIGKVKSGFIAVGDTATVVVDKHRRHAIMRNHTAAHLLQASLRAVLGTHVHQAGSMVNNEICRFDFTHFSATTPQQLAEVEKTVNDMILSAIPVRLLETSMDEAKKMGAIALFGDKYGEVVRVCDIEGASVELCGGTHVSNTAELGLFKIVSESSVAAGVRRIEGVTGRGVLALVANQERLLAETCAALKVGAPSELPAKAAAAAGQVRSLQRELDDMSRKLTGSQLSSITDNMPQVGPVKMLAAALENTSVDAMKKMADSLKDKYPDVAGVFTIKGEDKASVLVFAGKEAVAAGVHCGKLVKEVAAVAGGSGGGRPDNAMGGIPNQAKVDEARAAFEGLLKNQLGL